MDEVALLSHEAEFEGTRGRLCRRSVMPASGSTWARLALLHGYGDHAGRYLHVMQWMASRGVECHALDFRGHGLSSGRRGFVRRWDEYLDDLRAFLTLKELSNHRFQAPPLFLLGHSHGGLVAAAAGVRDMLECMAGCVLCSPYLLSKVQIPRVKMLMGRLVDRTAPWLTFATGISDTMLCADEELRRQTREDTLLLRRASPRWYFGMLDAQAQVMRQADRFNRPLLCLTAGRDCIADSAGAAAFCRQAGSADKTLRTYEQCLHELLRDASRAAIFDDILAWLRSRAPGMRQ